MGIIYCARNIKNDKKYVGKTVQTLQERWDGHVMFAHTERGWGIYFCRAIRKYGPDSFELSVLETVSDEDLNTAERRWIAALHTTDRSIGYNSTEGGEGFSTGDLNPSRLNPRKGPDNWCYGKPKPIEVREKISKSLTGLLVGEKNPFFGKTHTEETKRHISEIQIGQKRGPCSEEKKKKISEAQKGRKLTEEHKEKLKAAKVGKPGHPQSEETKRKIGEATAARHARKLLDAQLKEAA
jgi:group I intron endonuclease